MTKPIITIDYLKTLGYVIPDSSINSVNDKLSDIIEQAEEDYLQNTIGYELTSALYALDQPYPADVETFLNGLLVDGDLFYLGVKKEISSFIMAQYYAQNTININNSGFSTPIADGENMVQSNFMVNGLINNTLKLRCKTFYWLSNNMDGFFNSWLTEMFKKLQSSAVW